MRRVDAIPRKIVPRGNEAGFRDVAVTGSRRTAWTSERHANRGDPPAVVRPEFAHRELIARSEVEVDPARDRKSAEDDPGRGDGLPLAVVGTVGPVGEAHLEFGPELVAQDVALKRRVPHDGDA